MSQQNRKLQHFEDENVNGSIVEVNRDWAFNCEDNGNELREPELKMTALEVQILQPSDNLKNIWNLKFTK
jgi:hypothetical protein